MARQTELHQPGIGLKLLPDETLFSWCSRYHRLAANGLDRTTCLQLFGHRHIGSAHDFPARIDALAARSTGALGTADEIIQGRTLLPFYLPFRSADLGRQAVAALRGDGIGHLKYRLGLLTSGLGAAHPLKACPDCMKRDLRDTGWAYWRRSHQLPGVWSCLEHRVPLLVSHLKLDQVARFAWVLPIPARCQSVISLNGRAQTLASDGWLLRLSDASAALVEVALGSLANPTRTAKVLKRRMGDMGLMHASGRIRWSEAGPWLDRLAADLACVPGLNQDADKALLQNQLVRLLSARSLSHPLRYLVWIAMWFDRLEDFLADYNKIENGPSEPVTMEPTPRNRAARPGHMSESIETAVREGALSLTAAARESGVSYATMAAWACRMALEPPRRPKKLNDLSWSRAIGMLQSGADKVLVAKACDISIMTVTRILQTVTGLQETWHRVRHERRRTVARCAWESVLTLRPRLEIKAVRNLEPAAYAWLYRNDREWLRASYDAVDRVPAANHAAARIHGADDRIATVLRRMALLANIGTASWPLDDMKRALPALRRAIRRPEQWPLTVLAMRQVATCRRSAHPLLGGATEQEDNSGQ